MEQFLKFIGEIADTANAPETLASALRLFIDPIAPIWGRTVRIYGIKGHYITQLVFVEVAEGRGYYVTVHAKSFRGDELREMKKFCKLAEIISGRTFDIDTIHPIDIVLRFHIYINLCAQYLTPRECNLYLEETNNLLVSGNDNRQAAVQRKAKGTGKGKRQKVR